MRVFRHEFAEQGFGEQRRGELFDLVEGSLIAYFETINKSEEGFEAEGGFIKYFQEYLLKSRWRWAIS